MFPLQNQHSRCYLFARQLVSISKFTILPQCAVHRKLFSAIWSNLLLYYYMITHRPLTLWTSSAMTNHIYLWQVCDKSHSIRPKYDYSSTSHLVNVLSNTHSLISVTSLIQTLPSMETSCHVKYQPTDVRNYSYDQEEYVRQFFMFKQSKQGKCPEGNVRIKCATVSCMFQNISSTEMVLYSGRQR